MKYYLKIISLIGCPYSIKAENIVQEYDIENKITRINNDETYKYITDDITTFPQIYLVKKNSNGHFLLGGYDDLEECINLLGLNYNKNNVSKVMEKYNWNKRVALRLAELIN